MMFNYRQKITEVERLERRNKVQQSIIEASHKNNAALRDTITALLSCLKRRGGNEVRVANARGQFAVYCTQ